MFLKHRISDVSKGGSLKFEEFNLTDIEISTSSSVKSMASPGELCQNPKIVVRVGVCGFHAASG